MADVPISSLPAVTVPARTDVIPVVQGGTTKRETVAQIFSLLLAADIPLVDHAKISDWDTAVDDRITTALSGLGSTYYTETEVDDLLVAYQPLDADLTALAALGATAGMVKRTGAGAFSVVTLAAADVSDFSAAVDARIAAGALATDAEVASAISGLSSVYQPLDPDLTAIAGLSTTGFVERTGAGTAAARTLVAGDVPTITSAKLSDFNTAVDARIASAVTALGLGALATLNTVANAQVASGAAIAYSKLAALTASRALYSDASGVVTAHASVSDAELGYLDGVTSAIQTQLDGKQASLGFTATPNTRGLTAGAGLTGGGDLSADRAFAVGAGVGIAVNADDVALNLAGLVANQTLFDGSQASRTITFGLSGATDPVVTVGDNSFDLSTGVLKQGGTAVSLSGHTHAAATITGFDAAVDARIAAAVLNALFDVTITSPSDGEVLTYQSGVWINAAPTGGGSVATDAIWDAAGDLAVGSGANTAAKLSLGSALQYIRVNAGATGLEYATLSAGGDVTAASNFGTDNRLIRSDGTGKGVQASGITIDDSDNVTGAANLYRSGGTDVAVADGGTGASSASGARTALGIAIGADVQAWDADLDALAALDATAGYVVKTGANAYARRTLTGTSNQVAVTNGDGGSGNPVFSLPQSIHAAAAPQFGALGLGGAAGSDGIKLYGSSSGSLQISPAAAAAQPGSNNSPVLLSTAGVISFPTGTPDGSKFLRDDGAWAAGGSGYATVQEEGSGLTARGTLNFVGAGFTAADDAGNTRTNLSLDATLNALAAFNTNGLIAQTAADTFAGRTIAARSNGGAAVTNGDGVAGNPTIGLGSAQEIRQLYPEGSMPPGTLYATPDWRLGGSTPAETISVLDFDQSTVEYADWKVVLPATYNGGGLTVTFFFTATTATSGNVIWSAAIRRLVLDSEDVDASQTYDYNDSSATAVSSTNGALKSATVTFTNGADMDSWAAGEPAIVRVRRFASDAGDTLADDAELHAVVIRET
jgi:hypothetical protein